MIVDAHQHRMAAHRDIMWLVAQSNGAGDTRRGGCADIHEDQRIVGGTREVCDVAINCNARCFLVAAVSHARRVCNGANHSKRRGGHVYYRQAVLQRHVSKSPDDLNIRRLECDQVCDQVRAHTEHRCACHSHICQDKGAARDNGRRGRGEAASGEGRRARGMREARTLLLRVMVVTSEGASGELTSKAISLWSFCRAAKRRSPLTFNPIGPHTLSLAWLPESVRLIARLEGTVTLMTRILSL